jgi:hypothetical protein
VRFSRPFLAWHTVFSGSHAAAPPAPAAFRSAAIASAILAALALAAGAVRLLPWMFDPSVPWRVAAPFARGLASLALEAAILVGWPVGWALACVGALESGEARALQALGERPARTVARLAPQALLFAAALAGVALVWGRDASEPGRVATELLTESRTSCARAAAPKTYAVPFTELTWLCVPGASPRLVGGGGAMSGFGDTMFTATGARIAGDFRGLDLDDANLSLPTNPTTNVRVGALHLRGLAPWSHASTLAPVWRALVSVSSGLVAAALAAYFALRRAYRTRLLAIGVGAAGALAELGVVRLLERSDARALFYCTAPFASAAATVAAALVFSRLPRWIRAASTKPRSWGTSARSRS